MQLTIKEVSGQKNKRDGTPYWQVKAEDGKTYNLDKPVTVGAIGTTLECDVHESPYNMNGKQMVSRWATVKGTVEDRQQAAGSRQQAMNQFVYAEAVRFYWDVLKGFEMADDAKASVLCTCLIATADGRVPFELPPDGEADGEGMPF